MRKKFENVEPIVCNVFDFSPPVFYKPILKIYFKMLSYFPQGYQKMYDLGNKSGFVLKMCEYVSRYLAGRMAKFILSKDAALIISTHATPAGLVAHLKKEGKLKVPAAAVITDYVVHKLWVYPELDHYFVATEEMAQDLQKEGIHQTKIEITGIPIVPSFKKPADKNEICEKLGLDPAKATLLIMGGGAGLIPMDEIIETIKKTELFKKHKLQIIAVTGKNAAMYEKISHIAKSAPQMIKPFGYVENVHELMAVSDILISKPGGVTSAEALASGLPVLIYNPLPGQEEANARYLTSQGAAYLATSFCQLSTIFEKMVDTEPEKMAELKKKAKTIGKPDAAFDIADCLKRYV
jgi:processive 1,2-diacylglycerol beta-glucosyltransferase